MADDDKPTEGEELSESVPAKPAVKKKPATRKKVAKRATAKSMAANASSVKPAADGTEPAAARIKPAAARIKPAAAGTKPAADGAKAESTSPEPVADRTTIQAPLRLTEDAATESSSSVFALVLPLVMVGFLVLVFRLGDGRDSDAPVVGNEVAVARVQTTIDAGGITMSDPTNLDATLDQTISLTPAQLNSTVRPAMDLITLALESNDLQGVRNATASLKAAFKEAGIVALNEQAAPRTVVMGTSLGESAQVSGAVANIQSLDAMGANPWAPVQIPSSVGASPWNVDVVPPAPDSSWHAGHAGQAGANAAPSVNTAGGVVSGTQSAQPYPPPGPSGTGQNFAAPTLVPCPPPYYWCMAPGSSVPVYPQAPAANW